MKCNAKVAVNRWLGWLIALVLLVGLGGSPGYAEEGSLVPADQVYENGNIILHKSAERIGPNEWEIVVRATIGEMPVQKRKIEVVFLLDRSSSMDENAHDHTDECYEIVCGEDVHEHTDACYDFTKVVCGLTEHEHTDTCYGVCNLEEHTHSGYTGGCYTQCTKDTNRDHWKMKNNGNYEHNSSECNKDGNGNKAQYYLFVCQKGEHTHSSSCRPLGCGKEEHTHDANCGELICGEKEHAHTDSCIGSELACGFTVTTRLGVAAQVAERLISNLPEGTTVTRLAYDGNFTDGISSYYDVDLGSGTYTWTGIYKALTGGYFTDEPGKKIFILLNDGNVSSNDGNESNARNALNAFMNEKDGMVFTVGFAFDDDMLEGIAGNGGYYMYAQNATDLSIAFDKLEQTLTAMLEDPMGTSVGFDRTSIEVPETTSGVISTNDNTIFWNPAEDGTDIVQKSTIEYSYTVKLNDQADMSTGTHRVELNSPTYFRYGLQSNDGSPSEMKEAAFPIPVAEYKVSSIQTKWQADGQNILDPLPLESLVCDHASSSFIPAFKQDYRTITPIIPIEDSSDYYRYIGTKVTAGDTTLPGVDAVDPSDPVNYVVVHQYERVHSDELVISGTKTLVGRDFKEGDSFTFKLTGIDSAPMPEKTTVTIEPTSGTSEVFSFDSVKFTQAGTYTYTIQEESGQLNNVIYDSVPRNLVVTATEVDNNIVVSYTLDGVENGALTVTNRLRTGTLKVEKDQVISHMEAHKQQAFDFLIQVKDSSGRALDGQYEMQLNGGEPQPVTFTSGYATVELKAGESAEILGIPDGATYTVVEDAAGGFTVTATGDTGTVEADKQSVASFENEYHSAGQYQFTATKQLKDATMRPNQFSFKVMKGEQVVATATNNIDGSIFFDTLPFTEADIGTKQYTIVEEIGTEAGIVYDRTVHQVKLTITDQGNGALKIVDDRNGQPILFTNSYLENQFTVSKTVAGNIGSRNKEFSFTISLPDAENVTVSTDGGASFDQLEVDSDGKYAFTLRHGEAIIFSPVSGKYTVTEEPAAGYTTTYQVNQGETVQGNTATGTVGASGGHVAFTNTLEVPPPTGVHDSISYAVAGLCLAAALWLIKRMGGGHARYE